MTSPDDRLTMLTTDPRTEASRPDLSRYAIHTKHRGMAAKLAEEHYHRLLWVIGLGWHVWDGQRWAPDPNEIAVSRMVTATVRKAWEAAGRLEGVARKAAVRDIELCETANGTAGVLSLARSVPGLSVPLDQMDADPFLVNTASGTLDLRTMTMQPASPADYLTMVTTGAYSPTASAPRWNQFLERVLPDVEVREYVRRLFGYGLLGLVREHVMPIFTGTGQNGKSTLIEAIGTALGDYYAAVKPELLIATEHSRTGSSATPDLMQLRGKRIVSMVETAAGAKMDSPRVKNLTGGDTITARPLYRDIVTFTPTHLPILVTNHLPEVPADDPALWRRLAVAPFDVKIPDNEKDGQLPEALKLEADGILSWAIAGYADYVARGHRLDPPAAVGVRTAKYREDSNMVALWMTDCCVVDAFNSHVATRTEVLWDSWEQWARANRRPLGRRADLLAALLAVEGVYEKRIANVRHLSGISLIS